MGRKRVLVATTWFPDAAAPATAPFMLEHVRAIARSHDVLVVHVRLGGTGPVVSEDFGGIRVHRIPLSPRRPWTYTVLVRRLLAALSRADVLHTMAFTAAAVVAPVRLLDRTPWVHTEHWSGMADPRSVSRAWAAVAWLRYVLKLPDAVTAVSSAQAAQLRPFARRGAVSVVPNVVPAATGGGSGTGLSADGPLRLVATGALIGRKRPAVAVEALKLLRAADVDASLTWVGDGPLRADIEHQVDAAGLTGTVDLPGRVTPGKVHAFLASADLFLLPTAHETFCVAAAEAVAAGLPAVVTDLPAVRDFLTPDNSVLVPDGNSAGGQDGDDAAQLFADAVRFARNRFAGVPRAVIAATLGARFSAERIGDRFTDIYRALQ